MKWTVLVAGLGALLLSLTPAHACQFNTDCGIGAQCIKRGGSLYGYCAKGMQPGNRWDRQPVRDVLGGSTGRTCSYSSQCGAGHRCAKSGLYGVCVKSW